MARGTTLLELVGDLRVELGRAANVAVGPGDIPMLQRALRRVQKVLWTQNEWPFMRKVFPLIPLQAGQNMYDPPADLDLDRIESAAVWYNDEPIELPRGITFRDYSAYKPGDRADPVMRWDIRTNDEDYRSQAEVWPTPASNGYSLQFIGIRNLRPLVHDADRADLDDELLILFSAAQLLARQKAPDASIIMQQAQEHLAKCRAKASAGSSGPIRMGLGPDATNQSRRTKVYVAGYPVPQP